MRRDFNTSAGAQTAKIVQSQSCAKIAAQNSLVATSPAKQLDIECRRILSFNFVLKTGTTWCMSFDLK